MADTCKKDVAEFKSNMYDTYRVRKAVWHGIIGKSTNPIRDCAVSEWVEGPCSQACAAGDTQAERRPGMRDLSRVVQVGPGPHGAKCPPLEAKARCGEQPCPVDCVMGEWSGWTSCSHACGGGTRVRSRSVA